MRVCLGGSASALSMHNPTMGGCGACFLCSINLPQGVRIGLVITIHGWSQENEYCLPGEHEMLQEYYSAEICLQGVCLIKVNIS